MDRKDILNEVVNILVENLDVDSADVEEKTEIINGLGADSLDVVDIVKSIEDKFSLKVPDEDIENLKTVGDIVDYIETRKG